MKINSWIKFILLYIVVNGIYGIFYSYSVNGEFLSHNPISFNDVIGFVTRYGVSFLAPFLLGLIVSLVVNRKNTLPIKLTRALYIAVPLAGLLVYGSWYPNNQGPSTKVYTTIQAADGLTESSLDQDFLSKLEKWIIQNTLKKLKITYPKMVLDPKKISASSVYIHTGEIKLAVVRIHVDSYVRLVMIMGIKENELIRVNCIRASDQEFPVWSGVCGDKIQETFGVSFKP